MLKIGESSADKYLTSVFYITGLWFKENSSIFYRIYSFVLLFMLMLYVLCFDIGLILSDSIAQATHSLSVTMPVTVCFLKAMNLLYNNERIQSCLSRVHNFKLQNEEELQIAKAQLILFFKLTVFYGIICNVAVILVSIRVLFLSKPELPFDAWYPLDWKNINKDFWTVHSIQLYGMIVAVNINLTCELLPCFFLTMIGCQLDILGMRLVKLEMKTNKTVGQISSNVNDEIKISGENETMVVIDGHIQTHHYILKLIHDVQKSFDFSFFAEIMTVGITITSIAYQLAHLAVRSKHGDHDVVEYTHYIIFLLCTVTRIFMPCFFGNFILSASESLPFQIFSSQWLELSVSCRKKLIVLMERLKRPSVIMAWILFPLTLEVFKSIVNFSYTMLALLQNFK